MRMRAGTSIPLEDHHWDPEAEVAGPVDSATQQVARPDGSILAQPPAKSRSMRLGTCRPAQPGRLLTSGPNRPGTGPPPAAEAPEEQTVAARDDLTQARGQSEPARRRVN